MIHTQQTLQRVSQTGVKKSNEPDEEVQERIYQIMFERERDHRIGLFAIKPSVYEFEQEVRAIVYPKRELHDPIPDPRPDMPGLQVPIASCEPKSNQAISKFIEKIYVHPMLGEDSMMVQTIKEINRRFAVSEIPVVANKIEAMGADVVLPPLNKH